MGSLSIEPLKCNKLHIFVFYLSFKIFHQNDYVNFKVKERERKDAEEEAKLQEQIDEAKRRSEQVNIHYYTYRQKD